MSTVNAIIGAQLLLFHSDTWSWPKNATKKHAAAVVKITRLHYYNSPIQILSKLLVWVFMCLLKCQSIGTRVPWLHVNPLIYKGFDASNYGLLMSSMFSGGPNAILYTNMGQWVTNKNKLGGDGLSFELYINSSSHWYQGKLKNMAVEPPGISDHFRRKINMQPHLFIPLGTR